MVNKDILKYVENELSKGFSEAQIKNILIKGGHKIEDIEEAIARVYNKEKKSVIEEKKHIKLQKLFVKKHWFFLLIFLIVIVVLVKFTTFGANYFYGGYYFTLARGNVFSSQNEIITYLGSNPLNCEDIAKIYFSDCGGFITQLPDRKPVTEITNPEECEVYQFPQVVAICKAIVADDKKECIIDGKPDYKCYDFHQRRKDFLSQSCDGYISGLKGCKNNSTEKLIFGTVDLSFCTYLKAKDLSDCVAMQKSVLTICKECEAK